MLKNKNSEECLWFGTSTESRAHRYAKVVRSSKASAVSASRITGIAATCAAVYKPHAIHKGMRMAFIQLPT